MHTILVIDDDKTTLKAISTLCGNRYNIVEATSGEQGLELIEKSSPNVIVTDQKLPNMTGVSFLAEAQKLQPNAIRVLMTGHDDLSAVIDAINRGKIFLYLQKPFNSVALLDTLRIAVDSYDRNRASREELDRTLGTIREQLKHTQETLDTIAINHT